MQPPAPIFFLMAYKNESRWVSGKTSQSPRGRDRSRSEEDGPTYSESLHSRFPGFSKRLFLSDGQINPAIRYQYSLCFVVHEHLLHRTTDLGLITMAPIMYVTTA